MAPDEPLVQRSAVTSVFQSAPYSHDVVVGLDPDHQNGRAPYPPSIVISTERSGVNLVRHAVETLVSLRTPGKPHRFTHGRLAFHRTHWAYSDVLLPGRAPVYDLSGNPLYRKAMLLLRDPFEILARTYKCDLKGMQAYCDNILAFDRFGGDRLLVSYDELVTDDSVFHRIFDFLELGAISPDVDIPALRASAVQWYQTHQPSGSQTLGAPDRLRFHQQCLTNRQRRKLRNFLDSRLDGLAPRYLARWL